MGLEINVFLVLYPGIGVMGMDHLCIIVVSQILRNKHYCDVCIGIGAKNLGEN